MSSTSPKVLWYLRFSRLLGVFPVRILPDGTLEFCPWSALTLLAVALPLSYTVTLVHYMYFTLERQHLSYVFTMVPSTIVSGLTDYLIRLSSVWYCNDLIKFIALTAEGESQSTKGFMKCFWVVPALFFICSACRGIAQTIAMSQSGQPVTAGGTATGKHLLVASLLSASDLLHDGMLCSALCFVILFGKRALSSFALLCAEVFEFCRIQYEPTTNSALQIACKVKSINGKPYAADTQLAEKFVALKKAFGIYTKIGGLFVFALVTDTGTWLYYLACTVLFNNDSASAPFLLAMMAIQSLMQTLVIVTIAELGHLLDCQVCKSPSFLTVSK